MSKITVDNVVNYASAHLPVPITGETVEDLKTIFSDRRVSSTFTQYANDAEGLPESELPNREALLQTLGWTQSTLMLPNSQALFRHLSSALQVKGPDES